MWFSLQPLAQAAVAWAQGEKTQSNSCFWCLRPRLPQTAQSGGWTGPAAPGLTTSQRSRGGGRVAVRLGARTPLAAGGWAAPGRERRCRRPAALLKVSADPAAWENPRDSGDTLAPNAKGRSQKSAVALALLPCLCLSSRITHMSWDNAVWLVSCEPEGWQSHCSFTQLFFLSLVIQLKTIKKTNKQTQCQQNHI